MGDEFEGVLVSGFYGAYNVHKGLHQRCWTHLLRHPPTEGAIPSTSGTSRMGAGSI